MLISKHIKFGPELHQYKEQYDNIFSRAQMSVSRIPQISVKLPYLQLLGFNATIKIDDKE